MINQSPQQNNIYQVIKSYDNLIIKAYLLARFLIIHQRFLDEIGQYLPEKGKVIDLGCGFGLFSLYYAMQYPDLKILGIDINPKRIKMAKKSACKLSLSNAAFMVCDATALNIRTKVRGVYMLDLIHHIPVSAVRPLLCFLYDVLEPECRLDWSLKM